MRKVVLFIAMSLDGYIADRRGGVNWLGGQSADAESMVPYSAFIKDVDTVIMGRNTYRQISTELSPAEWIYSDLTSYVISHNPAAANPYSSADRILFTDEAPCGLVKKLKAESGKTIWICGGAEIVRQLMEEDLIDTYYISVIPTILGGGIRLFPALEQEMKLKLTGTQQYNGITDLIYERR